MSVRVRFAPSPTGYLHIGGARTALFNWIYARKTGGSFVLRVEDTDASRNSKEAMDAIIEGMRWLGLDWDEGPTSSEDLSNSQGDRGPYFQSQRKEIYLNYVQKLKDANMAYDHDGAVKFRMQREPVTIPDLVCGDVVRKLTDREEPDPDFVIVRSDGQPVFHLVNVVDDLEMGITHVIRGEDHLSNTAKHIALFKALGAEPPKFAHIPLILNNNGSKMSKRDQGASLEYYQSNGFAPEAVVNYLLTLGWTPPDDQEVISNEKVTEIFDLPQIHRANAKFDGDKLKWFNFEYIKELSNDRFRELSAPAFTAKGIDLTTFPNEYVDAAFHTCREKIKTFNELPTFATFYFESEVTTDPDLAAKFLTADAMPILESLKAAFEALPEFECDAIEAAIRNQTEVLELKMGKIVQPLRIALTGSKVGPSLWHLIEVLGKERTSQRIDAAISKIQA